MGAISRALLAVSLATGVAATERIFDPFERHPRDYVVEANNTNSDIPSASVNWYDASGDKHDDRTTDLLIGAALMSAAGLAALQLRKYPESAPANQPPTAE